MILQFDRYTKIAFKNNAEWIFQEQTDERTPCENNKTNCNLYLIFIHEKDVPW